MVKQLDSFSPALSREESGITAWFLRNIRHVGMTLSIAVIVYCFLYFVVLQSFVVMNTRTEQYAVKTEYIQLKQDAMITDMKKGGMKMQAVDKADKAIIEVSSTESK